jgi:hypothetical protein
MTATYRKLVAPSPYRTGVIIISIALVMGAAFALSYSLALGRPAPRHVKIGLIGHGTTSSAAVHVLRSDEKAFNLLEYPSFDVASRAIDRQQIYAIVDQDHARLYLSSAAGASVARLLQQVVEKLPPGQSIQVSDLHPLPRADPQGVTTFYVTIAATILGFVTMFQLRAHIDHLPLKGWLALLSGLAVLAGATLAVVSDPALGALHGPFFEIWLLLSVQCAIAALFNSAMLVLVHRWAILPTWGLFIVLGNTSSGGAVAAPLLPAPYAFLSRFLPTGATVSAVHTAVYFRNDQHLEPFLVLAGWLLATGATLVISSRLLGRTPTD